MISSRLAVLGLLAASWTVQAADSLITPDHLSLAYLIRPIKDARKRSSLCGMHVLASKETKGEPTIQWDFIFSVITDGSTKIAGISAGSFERALTGKVRTPRHEIAELRLLTEGDAEPLLVPVSKHGNPVLGAVPVAYANKVLDALDSGTPLSILITYADGQPESLLIKGRNNVGKFNLSKNQVVRECIETIVPAKEPSAPYMEINTGSGR